MPNFNHDFKNFKSDTAYISQAHANQLVLESLGIDADAEDTVFGAKFVYCGAHMGAHSVGWCTVGIDQKRPLNATTITDAITEVSVLGFKMV